MSEGVLDDKAQLAERNIRRMMEMHQLWPFVEDVRLVTADRIFFRAGYQMVGHLDVGAAHGTFSKEWSSGGPHRLALQLWRGYDEWQRPVSWRLKERPSLQITLARVRAEHGVWHHVGDADIDLSPPMDVVGALIHLVEVLVPGKTDHRKLEARIGRKYAAWIESQGRTA